MTPIMRNIRGIFLLIIILVASKVLKGEGGIGDIFTPILNAIDSFKRWIDRK